MTTQSHLFCKLCNGFLWSLIGCWSCSYCWRTHLGTQWCVGGSRSTVTDGKNPISEYIYIYMDATRSETWIQNSSASASGISGHPSLTSTWQGVRLRWTHVGGVGEVSFTWTSTLENVIRAYWHHPVFLSCNEVGVFCTRILSLSKRKSTRGHLSGRMYKEGGESKTLRFLRMS